MHQRLQLLKFESIQPLTNESSTTLCSSPGKSINFNGGAEIWNKGKTVKTVYKYKKKIYISHAHIPYTYKCMYIWVKKRQRKWKCFKLWSRQLPRRCLFARWASAAGCAGKDIVRKARASLPLLFFDPLFLLFFSFFGFALIPLRKRRSFFQFISTKQLRFGKV